MKEMEELKNIKLEVKRAIEGLVHELEGKVRMEERKKVQVISTTKRKEDHRVIFFFFGGLTTACQETLMLLKIRTPAMAFSSSVRSC